MWGHFEPWDQNSNNLNKLANGSLGDAKYKISKVWALRFQRRRFFKVFTMKN